MAPSSPLRDSPSDHHHYSSQFRTIGHSATHELSVQPQCLSSADNDGQAHGAPLMGGDGLHWGQCEARRARGTESRVLEAASVLAWHECV